MSKQNDPVKKKPTIKIVVSSTEYDTLKMEAEKRGLSIQEYGHRRLFDDVNGVEDSIIENDIGELENNVVENDINEVENNTIQ